MSFIPTVVWLRQRRKIKRFLAFLGGIVPVIYLVGWVLVWWQSSTIGGEPAKTSLRILTSASEQNPSYREQENRALEGKVSASEEQKEQSALSILSIRSESKEGTLSETSSAKRRLILPVLLETKQGPPVDKPVHASAHLPAASGRTSTERKPGGDSGPKPADTGNTAAASIRMRELPEEAGKVSHDPPPPGFAEVSHEPQLQVVVAEGTSSSGVGLSASQPSGQEVQMASLVGSSPEQSKTPPKAESENSSLGPAPARIPLAIPPSDVLCVHRPSLSQARPTISRSEPSTQKASGVQEPGTMPSSAIVIEKESKSAAVDSSDPVLARTSSVPKFTGLTSSSTSSLPLAGRSHLAGSGATGSSSGKPSPSALSGPILSESPGSSLTNPVWPMLGGASAVTAPASSSTPPSRIALVEAEPAKTATEPAPANKTGVEPVPAKALAPSLPSLPKEEPAAKAPDESAKPAEVPVAGGPVAEAPPKPASSPIPGPVAPGPPPGGETSAPGVIPPPVAGTPPVDTRPQSAQWQRPTAEITQIGPFEVRGHSEELKVVVRRSKILRSKVDIYRVSVVDPAICDVVQFTPRELAIIGRSQGATDVTFWFADERYEPITYLVRVIPDPELQQRREEQYGILEDVLAELFPESKVKLIPVADKLIVKGQARDAEEAAQIMAIIRGQMVYPRYQESYGLVQGQAAPPLAQDPQSAGLLPAMQVINMLYIPGVQQVALKVKIAELNRSAARKFGVDMDLNFVWEDGLIAIRQLLNLATSTAVVSGTFDNDRLQFGIHYLQQHGVMRILSEPTLVTLSGRPATFVAGGEFAVPTTVGVAGAAAVTTDFRAFGAIITFLPIVLDKDLIRLEVAPEFSRINRENTVNGTPGLDTRAVTTTVELREGQTLAIAGLLEDSMKGDNTSNIPLFGQIFGKRNMNRNETELIILVTPELIHPMEPEEVPPLPGFDVTEPTNLEFYLKGRLEGRPTHEYRSTVWPRLRHRYQAGGPATISGPFGHSK